MSAAIRAVRLRRRMTLIEAARAMGIPLRSYQYFESGAGRLNFEAVLHFAAVTDSDPVALIAAVMLAAPSLAADCADNKLATALVLLLDDLHQLAGERISQVSSPRLVRALRETLNHLLAPDIDDQRDAENEDWLNAKLDKILDRARRLDRPSQ